MFVGLIRNFAPQVIHDDTSATGHTKKLM
uniref:Uncharacterized protein n=1 Tax=Anguilla anguilla TaxID=7936 RepID=A0A0E9RWC1_ANGAN